MKTADIRSNYKFFQKTKNPDLFTIIDHLCDITYVSLKFIFSIFSQFFNFSKFSIFTNFITFFNISKLSTIGLELDLKSLPEIVTGLFAAALSPKVDQIVTTADTVLTLHR